MDPRVLQGGFRIAMLVLVLALAMLPFQNRASAEFVVTVLSLVVGLAFVAVIAVLARVATPRIPGDRAFSDDKGRSNRYNSRDHQGGKR